MTHETSPQSTAEAAVQGRAETAADQKGEEMTALPLLCILALLWLITAIRDNYATDPPFSSSGLWFQAVIVAAVLLTFGLLHQ